MRLILAALLASMFAFSSISHAAGTGNSSMARLITSVYINSNGNAAITLNGLTTPLWIWIDAGQPGAKNLLAAALDCRKNNVPVYVTWEDWPGMGNMRVLELRMPN
jgi:hypothetical protein